MYVRGRSDSYNTILYYLALFGMVGKGKSSTFADGVANAPSTNTSITSLQK